MISKLRSILGLLEKPVNSKRFSIIISDMMNIRDEVNHLLKETIENSFGSENAPRPKKAYEHTLPNGGTIYRASFALYVDDQVLQIIQIYIKTVKSLHKICVSNNVPMPKLAVGIVLNKQLWACVYADNAFEQNVLLFAEPISANKFANFSELEKFAEEVKQNKNKEEDYNI